MILATDMLAGQSRAL